MRTTRTRASGPRRRTMRTPTRRRTPCALTTRSSWSTRTGRDLGGRRGFPGALRAGLCGVQARRPRLRSLRVSRGDGSAHHAGFAVSCMAWSQGVACGLLLSCALAEARLLPWLATPYYLSAGPTTHGSYSWPHFASKHGCLKHTGNADLHVSYCRCGDWGTARGILTETRSCRHDDRGQLVLDGPSGTLLGYMESLGWQAPTGWPGFRELTEK